VAQEYADAGFSGDVYATEDGQLRCGSCDVVADPERYEVHSIRRLEGMSDPSDMSAVLAVVCPACGARATAVLRVGPEAGPGDQRVWLGIRDRRGSGDTPPASTPAEGDAGR
jgi:hypothetical protein